MNKNLLTCAVGVVFALLLAMWPALVYAAPFALPPRPSPGPMPTMTAVPPPVPTGTPQPHSQPAVGGSIVLQARSARAGLWSVVQWQDGHGEWHDVSGWIGTFDEIVYDSRTASSTGYKTWWVSPIHLGAGPFRWVIYRERSRHLLGVSDPFFLPARDGQETLVKVILH